jgi:hypothetical protein
VAPSALHTLFSRVTWWRAHNMLELGTDSYTEVGARRRRSGGGPGGGCVRRPVGTYLYLHAVGARNPLAVPSLAR